MDYDCAFIGTSKPDAGGFILKVKVSVTGLCGCRKAISDYGAHHQRGYVTIQVRSASDPSGPPQLVMIDDIVQLGEAATPVCQRVNHESIHNHGAFASLEWTRPTSA